MFTLLTVLVLAAQPAAEQKADLDGDGTAESISITGDVGTFTLKAGATSITAKVPGNEIDGVLVVDLDGSDKRKEIAVQTTGEMDEDHRVVLYSYERTKLVEIGRLRNIGEPKGNGVVLETTWQGFYKRTDKHALDRKTGKLVEVPQELYAVGVKGTVKKSAPLHTSRSGAAIVANLAEGSQVDVLAFDPKGKWYLVRSSTDLVGWMKDKELGALELPWAG